MYLSSEQFSLTTGNSIVSSNISTLLKKGSGTLNEDVILCGKNATYGVFDGATSLVSTRLDNDWTGGRMAAQICAKIFGEVVEDLTVCAGLANREIYERAISYGVNFRKKEELWSTSAAVMRLNTNSFSWCQIGDCHILVIYKDGSFRLLNHDPSHDVATLQSWQKRSKTEPGAIMDVMADEILKVRKNMNVSYGVFNGELEAFTFLQSGNEPLAGVREVILFSDGLIPPRKNPAKPIDIAKLVLLYESGGLAEIQQYVHAMQCTDLDCRIYPRFKTHDDIGAVALSFVEPLVTSSVGLSS